MPAKKSTGGVTASDVEKTLPKTFFVKRGDIVKAFGFTREEVSVLIADGVFAAKYPFGKSRTVRRRGKDVDVAARARFSRAQVLEVARRWESER